MKNKFNNFEINDLTSTNIHYYFFIFLQFTNAERIWNLEIYFFFSFLLFDMNM